MKRTHAPPLTNSLSVCQSTSLPVLDVIKPFTTVSYGRKLCRQYYKACLRPYFTPTEPSSGVITGVKSRHWQRRNISYGRKKLHNIQHSLPVPVALSFQLLPLDVLRVFKEYNVFISQSFNRDGSGLGGIFSGHRSTRPKLLFRFHPSPSVPAIHHRKLYRSFHNVLS